MSLYQWQDPEPEYIWNCACGFTVQGTRAQLEIEARNHLYEHKHGMQAQPPPQRPPAVPRIVAPNSGRIQLKKNPITGVYE